MSGFSRGRVVEVRVRKTETGRIARGSGYLVSPDLVLTTGHVVIGPDGSPRPDVRVRRLDDNDTSDTGGGAEDGGWSPPAAVVWPVSWPVQRPADGIGEAADADLPAGPRGGAPPDLALVRLAAPAALPRGSEPAWGRFTGSAGRQPCELAGFPRVLRDEDNVRHPDHLTGHVNPLATGQAGDRFYVHIDDARPAGWTGGPSTSAWAGLSGAAVFSGGLLVGVVKDDKLDFAGGRLTATPITTVASDPTFAGLAAGQGAPRVELGSVELGGVFEPARVDRGQASPASLLRPDRAAVGFYGRHAERASLNAWCEDDDAVPVRLVVGPGGQGKTRLALRVCADRRASEWVAGALAPKAPDAAIERLTRTQVPVLLVVDYAETRLDQLRTLLVQPLISSLPVDGQLDRYFW